MTYDNHVAGNLGMVNGTIPLTVGPDWYNDATIWVDGGSTGTGTGTGTGANSDVDTFTTTWTNIFEDPQEEHVTNVMLGVLDDNLDINSIISHLSKKASLDDLAKLHDVIAQAEIKKVAEMI